MKNTWTIVGVVLIVILLFLLLVGVGMTGFVGLGGRGMMGGFGNYGMLGGLGLFGGLLRAGFNLLILAGIVLFIVWVARKAGKMPMGVSQTPLDILKTRYAKGEVTKEQFDTMKKDLEA